MQSVDPLGLNTIALGAGAGAAVGGPLGAVVGGIIGAVAGVGLYFAATSNSESEEQAKTQVLSCATTRPKCLEATPENIRQVVQPTPWLALQDKVSVPAVARYTHLLESGSVAPPVKMDGNTIVEGNHRMVAGLLCNQLPAITPGTAPLSRQALPFKDIIPDSYDWGNY